MNMISTISEAAVCEACVTDIHHDLSKRWLSIADLLVTAYREVLCNAIELKSQILALSWISMNPSTRIN